MVLENTQNGRYLVSGGGLTFAFMFFSVNFGSKIARINVWKTVQQQS